MFEADPGCPRFRMPAPGQRATNVRQVSTMIDHYSFGRVTFQGRDYTSDVLIYRGRVTPWWRVRGHSICEDDVDDLLAEKPGSLIIGTGAYGIMRVPKDFRELVEARGIRLVVKKTAEAVQEFNDRLARGEDVAIGMHLTC